MHNEYGKLRIRRDEDDEAFGILLEEHSFALIAPRSCTSRPRTQLEDREKGLGRMLLGVKADNYIHLLTRPIDTASNDWEPGKSIG